MESTRSWEEARVTIDIETKKIKFKAFYEISEEDKKDYEEDGAIFREININFDEIKFEDIFEIKAFIDKSNYLCQYEFENKFNNKFISLIL